MALISFRNVVKLCLLGLVGGCGAAQNTAARNLATIRAIYNETVSEDDPEIRLMFLL